MADFVAYLTRTEHLLLMIAVWTILSVAQRAIPGLAKHPVWVRLLPAAPVALCLAFVWVPGVAVGSPAEKGLLAIVLGSFAGHAHKLVKQSVFGDDKRIRHGEGGF